MKKWTTSRPTADWLIDMGETRPRVCVCVCVCVCVGGGYAYCLRLGNVGLGLQISTPSIDYSPADNIIRYNYYIGLIRSGFWGAYSSQKKW